MEKNKKSRFFQLIDIAISMNRDDIIRSLYTIKPFISPDVEIIYNSDIGVMELVTRTLVFVDLETKFFSGKFTLLNCPEEEKEFMDWFIKFFAYLESSDPYYSENNYTVYEANENHYSVFEGKWTPDDLKIDELLFGYSEVIVEYNSFVEFNSEWLEN